ncbi:MAG TPA: hypothetical protein VK528_06865 [Flavobacterium sp.]|nr:hypothetical protein [Flavobacterium sp.]
MGTLNNKDGQQKHDGQKNYQNSNQRNPDNVRNNTRDHEYKEYDKTLTNDENYDINSHIVKGNPDFDDTKDNADKKKPSGK